VDDIQYPIASSKEKKATGKISRKVDDMEYPIESSKESKKVHNRI
jgi:hypothetical protein